MSQPLNPITFPLYGQRLIEASAGTGKTYTITGLYLRLLLGHGSSESAFDQPLSVDQILVVTFTEAATQELKDRICLRIKAARKAFSAFIEGNELPEDDFLVTLITDTEDPEDAKRLLNHAERQMDEAAIFTINGFCMRMLQQHAFESGSLFNIKLCEDDSELKLNAVKDFWRQQFYPLPQYLVEIILACWKNPESLFGEVGFLLSDKPIQFLNDLSIDDIEALHQSNVDKVSVFKAELKSGFDGLVEAITQANTNKQFKNSAYRANWFTSWIAQVSSWLESPSVYQIPDNLYRFGSQCLEEKVKPEEHLELDWTLAQTVQDFIENPPQIKPALKQHAIRICRTLYQGHKRKQGVITFDDQISTLAGALSDPASGPLFAQKLRTQFPVAMVDEFQDTDESQYQIFNTVYGALSNSGMSIGDTVISDTSIDNTPEEPLQRTGLFMIGDPKQAIYGFRGGDIFTYMKARTQSKDHYSLDTNWRSSASMVEAVNSVFDQADSPFIYDDQIPFDAVLANAGANAMAWTVEGERQPAMTLWQPDADEPFSKETDYRAYLTDATANEVARLLSLSDQGEVWLNKGGHKTGELKTALKPSDIAILVRSAGQAKAIRDALSERGVASVYSSERSSVFEQAEAMAVLRILKAALTPENESLIKAAVGSELFGWTASQLNQLNEDEHLWEGLILEFRHFQKIWAFQGVLPALHQLMFKHQLAQILKSQMNGERKLTDFLHLCELLQSESKSVESQYALVAWLEERIQKPNQNAKEQQLRLESEQDLVQVVTYHKSKGLEYDIVFAPFISYPVKRPGAGIITVHNEAGDALVDVENQEQIAAEKERLAEDIRLLYVTLTRSVYACYLGLPGVMPTKPTKKAPDPIKVCPAKFHTTGLGWLCTQGEAVTPSQLDERLSNWKHACPEMMIDTPLETRFDYQPPESEPPQLDARKFAGKIDQNWWVTSYSRLVSEGHDHHYEPELFLSDEDLQGNYDASIEDKAVDASVSSVTEQGRFKEATRDTATDNDEDQVSIHTFPKGADPGTFLHTLFEEIEYQDCQQDAVREQIKALIKKSALAQQVIDQILPFYTLLGLSDDEKAQREAEALEQWVDVLHQLVINVLSKPLTTDKHAIDSPLLMNPPVLMNTQPAQRLVELEFLIPMAEISAVQVNRVIAQDALSARASHTLSFQQVQGMLKGFIDLTFEYQGKYYVLDWKSNYLGDDATAYTQEAMQEAMIDHRYDFQYQLYTLALHRYLKSRLPDYDYDQHIGGAYYIFLRGITNQQSDSNTQSQNGVFFTRPDRTMIEALDALFSGNPITTIEHTKIKGEPDAPEIITTTGEQGELF